MRDLLTDKEKAINAMLTYGIYRFSCTLSYTLVDTARHAIYCCYRGGLFPELQKEIKSLKSKTIGKNDEFFRGGQFEADGEIIELVEAFAAKPKLKELAIEFYRIHQSREFLNLRNPNALASLNYAKEIDRMIQANEPMPMANKSHLFNFRDHPKSEYELIQFAAFTAIKSIIGKKAYAKTNKQHIICRMLGYSSIKSIPENLDGKPGEVFRKYSNRYHFKKLLDDLQLNWNVVIYSHQMRGLCITISSKITRNELAVMAEANKRKSKLIALKKLNDEAISYAKSVQQLK
jgi:hypothetical protein